MEHCLLIVAAGKSSRFDGFPKAFVKIGTCTNVENTIKNASQLFDKVFLGVNRETYEAYKDNILGCEMFCIETGNGDAHSLLKCMKYVRTKVPNITRLAVCWGDAFFINGQPFAEIANVMDSMQEDVPVIAACSVDSRPYAWFETEGKVIKRSHFASCDGQVKKELHDQSLFLFNIDLGIRYLEYYKDRLQVPDGYAPDLNKEMKLLYSFDFLYESEMFHPAEYTVITAGNVHSFNTKNELQSIIKNMDSIRGGN